MFLAIRHTVNRGFVLDPHPAESCLRVVAARVRAAYSSRKPIDSTRVVLAILVSIGGCNLLPPLAADLTIIQQIGTSAREGECLVDRAGVVPVILVSIGDCNLLPPLAADLTIIQHERASAEEGWRGALSASMARHG